MKKMFKKLITSLLVLIGTGFCFAIPQNYYPNYEIQDEWDNIIKLLVKIEAAERIGDDEALTKDMFSELNKGFADIFPYFPQNNPNYNVVYEQCLITTKKLSRKIDLDEFYTFRDVCFQSINDIIAEIDRKYTVKARIQANPISGSVPLTVTLDGRSSTDPSNDTIPSSNYFWYYKDTNGVTRTIGTGPVQKHTFAQPGNYIVHLTVRSVNSKTHGVFDGATSVSIDVEPKAAILSVYVNSKKMSPEYDTKVGTEEAKTGILIDGSGTNPTGGRTIMSHRWEVTGVENGFEFVKADEGDPRAFRLQLGTKGEYKIKLIVRDNENNTISETYRLIVSDPIAQIKYKPETGNTSEVYYFDASLSYSVKSKIKTYKWTIFDPDGTQIDSFESRNFNKIFSYPGTYTVKLTVVDELGNSSDDQVKFYVESTPPETQFTINPVRKRRYPSEFKLDGLATTDIDEINGYDSLQYEWRFDNEENIEVLNRLDNNKVIMVAFNEPGTYTVKLRVTDQRGKMSEREREIEIKSTIRPELFVKPTAVTVGEPMNFIVKTNKSVAFYEWDMGNKHTTSTKENTYTYIYDKAGAYKMKLKVTSQSGEENEVDYIVFAGRRGYPIAAYEVSESSNIVLTQNEICVVEKDGKTYDYPAYGVDRGQQIILDATDSVNTRGTKSDLKIFFHPKNDEIYIKDQMQYKFKETGCQYVDLTVEDEQAIKTDQQRIWFKVHNALPTLKNIGLEFPQYGNAVGIGFNQGTNSQAKADIFSTDYDPLITKVLINGAYDPDGMISRFVWYYYKKADPERLLEVKITPPNVPYTIFSLPRIPGDFAFGVKIYDNDGDFVRSEDLLGGGPVVPFPPDTKNPDIPIVDLIVQPRNTRVGDKVEFTVKSRILSDRSDFASTRIIKYDFDGDGEYDLTTKRAKVEHIYQEEGKFRPKVRVVYRGYAGIGFADVVDVQKGLKAKFMYDLYDNQILVRDISYGNISHKKYCMDVRKCKNGEKDKYEIENKDYLLFEYDEYGQKIITAVVDDEYGNIEHDKAILDVQEEQDPSQVRLMSVPQAMFSGGNYNIDLGEVLNNKILYNVVYLGEGQCFIDVDITKDTQITPSLESQDDNELDNTWQGDLDPANDHDIPCNHLKLQQYTPPVSTENITSRLYYASGDKLLSRDIIIDFIDSDASLPDEYKVVYENLNNIINAIQEDDEDEDVRRLVNLLTSLRGVLGDKTATASLVYDIDQWLTTYSDTDKLQSVTYQEIKDALRPLRDKAITAALGGNEYEQAKADILVFLPESAQDDALSLFENIEQAQGDKEAIKGYLQQMINLAQDQVDAGSIDYDDFNIIKMNVCTIIEYYAIVSSACGGEEVPVETSQEGGSIVLTILKWVGIVLGVLFVIFIILTLIFAIKAKRQQESQNKEKEEDKPTSSSKSDDTGSQIPKQSQTAGPAKPKQSQEDKSSSEGGNDANTSQKPNNENTN